MGKRYVFCMKWGNLYGPEYVNTLYSMVKRNLSLEFQMVCLTDDDHGIHKEINCFPIPISVNSDNLPERMWKKLTVFKEDLFSLKGTALFLDLDIVIVDKIDDFFTYPGEFLIIKDYGKPWRKTGNSSVFRWTLGNYGDIYTYFLENFSKIRKNHRNEQEYLTWAVDNKGLLKYWPKKWCPSFKYDCHSNLPFAFWKTPNITEGAKIIIFHGEINPHKAIKGGFGKWYRYIPAAQWIREYWK